MCHVAVRANVVKVSVREYLAADLVLIGFEVADIRRDVVDAWVISTWEQEAHVNDDDVVFVLDSHAVLTDAHFAEPADRHDFQLRTVRLLCTLLVGQAELFAFVAVIHRFVHRYVYDVLGST